MSKSSYIGYVFLASDGTYISKGENPHEWTLTISINHAHVFKTTEFPSGSMPWLMSCLKWKSDDNVGTEDFKKTFTIIPAKFTQKVTLLGASV